MECELGKSGAEECMCVAADWVSLTSREID